MEWHQKHVSVVGVSHLFHRSSWRCPDLETVRRNLIRAASTLLIPTYTHADQRRDTQDKTRQTHNCRQTDRETDRQTNRQTRRNRQTDRQTGQKTQAVRQVSDGHQKCRRAKEKKCRRANAATNKLRHTGRVALGPEVLY